MNAAEFLRKLVECLDTAIEEGGPHAKAELVLLALRHELDDWRRSEEMREATDED